MRERTRRCATTLRQRMRVRAEMSKTRTAIGQWLWQSSGGAARLSRLALAPASAAFGAIVARRNARFDAAARDPGNTHVRPTALPALSIGNLTVGGTGKTPLAAWCVRELRRRGAQPSVVMRGYGDDEWRVHTLLNPGVPVIVAPDRLDGIALAKTRGANCVIMDDAFQHRRAARVADVVLVSADAWDGAVRLLPSGPYREPFSALRRATVVVITVKAATSERVGALELAIRNAAPDVPVAVVRLTLGTLKLAATLPATGASPAAAGAVPASRAAGPASSRETSGLLERGVDWLQGRKVVVASAIGDPQAFEAQLARAGAVVTPIRFGDHHAFTTADAEAIVRQATGTDGVVCTLKDAVKLGPVWPRVAPSLWYVSQSVMVERGAPALERAVDQVRRRALP